MAQTKIAIVALAVALVAAACGGSSSPEASETGFPRDGQFEFELTSPPREIPDEGIYEAGPGKVFVSIGMKIRNIGDEERSFNAFNTTLFLDGVGEDNYIFRSEPSSVDIRPGGEIETDLVWRVPRNWASSEIVMELKDSSFSGGVDYPIPVPSS